MTPMTAFPSFVPVLSPGKHKALTDGACAMEMVAFLAGEPHSDAPECTHPVLAELARSVNDHVDGPTRQRLAPLLPDLIGTADGDRVLEVALATWCARQAAGLLKGDDLTVALNAIRAGEAWCDDPTAAAIQRAFVAGQACFASYDAPYRRFHVVLPLTAATHAAWSTIDATRAVIAAASTCAALYKADRADDLPDLLAGAIAEYRRLTATAPLPADVLDWGGLSAAMEGATS